MDPKNLRLSKRIPIRERVKFGSQNPEYIGHTVNFSKMGIQIESTKVFPPGTSLVIEILDRMNIAGSSSTAAFLGKVVWSEKGISYRGKMGIEYLTQSSIIENEYNRISN